MTGQELTLGFVLGGALLDSINPCVFGVLIFLLAFMTRVLKSKHRMLMGGLWYTFVVYCTYLAIGFGILKLAVNPSLTAIFYWGAALVAIIAGLLEIKDFFWYGKGFSLQMLPGAGSRIKAYTARLERMQANHPRLMMLSIGIIGVFVVLVELPCTGAPYFAVLNLLAQGSYAEAIPLLLLYNFIFVLPLLVVIFFAYLGVASERLELWRQAHKGLMRLVVGVFLIALGIYMIYTVSGSGI